MAYSRSSDTPEWNQEKLNQQMRDLRKDKAATGRQLADMGTALDTGRQVFLTALTMLARPRDTYDHGDDTIKTTLARTIFGKLHLNATPTGTVTATTTAPAEPFADHGRFKITSRARGTLGADRASYQRSLRYVRALGSP